MELIIIALIAFEATLVSTYYCLYHPLIAPATGFHSRRTRDLEDDHWQTHSPKGKTLKTALTTFIVSNRRTSLLI